MKYFFLSIIAAIGSLFGIHSQPIQQLAGSSITVVQISTSSTIGNQSLNNQSTATSVPIMTESTHYIQSNQSGQKVQMIHGSTLNTDRTESSTSGDKVIQDVFFSVSSYEHNTAISIKEPNGHEVGYDPQANGGTGEIPDLAECLENGYIADAQGGPSQSTGNEECDIYNPIPGTYVVSVFGKSGEPYSYELDTEIDYYASSSVTSIYGTSTAGSSDTYSIKVGQE